MDSCDNSGLLFQRRVALSGGVSVPKWLKIILTILALLAGFVLILIVLAMVWPEFNNSVMQLIGHVLGELDYIFETRF